VLSRISQSLFVPGAVHLRLPEHSSDGASCLLIGLEQTQIDTAKDVIDIAGNHLLSQFLGIANMRRPGGNDALFLQVSPR
jgi:hypothetical protein